MKDDGPAEPGLPISAPADPAARREGPFDDVSPGAAAADVGGGGGSRRETWVDAVKGITITLVVLHHNYSGFKELGAFGDLTLQLYALLSPVRMPLFFLVAGFFARKSLFGPWNQFAGSKLVHFAWLYLLWSVISISIRAALDSITTSSVAFSDLLQILWQPGFTLWFLYALFVAFLVARLTRAVPPPVQIGVALLVAALAKQLYHDSDLVLVKTAQLYPCFVIGIYASAPVRRWVEASGPRDALGALALFAGLAAVAFHWRATQNPLLYYPMAASSSAAIMALVYLARQTPIMALFGYIGERSLYIYLLHFLPAGGTRILATRLGLAEQPWPVIFAGTIASIIFCLIVHRLIGQLWLFRYLYERPRLRRKPGGEAVGGPAAAGLRPDAG
jgi:uncharacterized membrane protein YcfT